MPLGMGGGMSRCAWLEDGTAVYPAFVGFRPHCEPHVGPPGQRQMHRSFGKAAVAVCRAGLPGYGMTPLRRIVERRAGLLFVNLMGEPLAIIYLTNATAGLL